MHSNLDTTPKLAERMFSVAGYTYLASKLEPVKTSEDVSKWETNKYNLTMLQPVDNVDKYVSFPCV